MNSILFGHRGGGCARCRDSRRGYFGDGEIRDKHGQIQHRNPVYFPLLPQPETGGQIASGFPPKQNSAAAPRFPAGVISPLKPTKA
jgi:hypothetical protein